MNAAILCIGTEITRGELTNTNASWLAEELTDLGYKVVCEMAVDDHFQRIENALRDLSAKASVLVCTGGLGPTTDDMTSEAVANTLGVDLVRDDESLDLIEQRISRSGRKMTESNKKQAYFPRGSEIYANEKGTAPGFSVLFPKRSQENCKAFFFPGVPTEMKHLFLRYAKPWLQLRVNVRSHQIRYQSFGLPESAVGERLKGVEELFPGVTLGYRAHIPEIEIKVLAEVSEKETEKDAKDLANRAALEVKERLKDVIYSEGGDHYGAFVLSELRKRGLTLAVAESCTGGLVGHMLTREPGASDVLIADIVAYANSSKTKFLDVSPTLIGMHGAVSEEVALAMVEGVLLASSADVGLAITGVAGPSGATPDKPVGHVCFAVSAFGVTKTKSERMPFQERDRIQTIAAYRGLHWMLSHLSQIEIARSRPESKR